jgi:hypothetical protein
MHGSMNVKWGLTLNGNTAWGYPSASIHFTNAFQKKCFSQIFCDLFQVNGNIIKSIGPILCWQSRQSAASESDHFSRVLGHLILNSHERLFD